MVVLLEEGCPLGTLTATVEGTDRSAYLFAEPPWEAPVRLRSLWLANHGPAPAEDDLLPLASDTAPAPPLPAWAVRRPGGDPPLPRSSLRIVWEPGGDGCAVLAGDEPLGWMPSATAHDIGHPGYAAGATADHQRARPLAPVRPAFDRWLADAERFWAVYGDAAWSHLQEAAGAHLARALGPRTASWAIDDDVWPPCVASQHRTDAATHVTSTVGMALQPQPGSPVDQRIELAVATAEGGPGAAALLRQLCRAPWTSLRTLRHGQPLPVDPTEAPASWSRFAAALVVDTGDPAGPTRMPGMPEVAGLHTSDGATVRYLWLVGVTAAEAEEAAGGATALLERLGLTP